MRNIVGYMTGLEWPHDVEIAIDGERVFLAQVGGEEDNAVSDANMSAAANAIDERLRTRVFVPGGPARRGGHVHREERGRDARAAAAHKRNLDLQDMNGLPLLDYVNIRGPFDAKGSGSTPSRERIFTAARQSRGRRDPVRDARSCRRSRIARTAARSPSRIIALLLRFYSDGRKQRHVRRRHRERARG